MTTTAPKYRELADMPDDVLRQFAEVWSKRGRGIRVCHCGNTELVHGKHGRAWCARHTPPIKVPR